MIDYTSNQALTDFVYAHNLRAENGNIVFMALATLSTKERKLTNQQVKVVVRFDDLGELSIQEPHLDPEYFPSQFSARYQTFEHVSGEYVFITGTHAQRPRIGRYEVKIHALHKTSP